MTNPIPASAPGATPAALLAELGDLLDFTPVPRRTKRVDGWTPELQQAFIAALSVAGSARRAAKALGKSATGVIALRQRPGAESFAAAWDAAMAIARERGSARLAISLNAVVEEALAWRPPPPPWSRAATRAAPVLPRAEPAPPTDDGEQEPDSARLALLEQLVGKYLQKLGHEREARLAGRIAEADFYLRQLTVIEVSFDLMSGDGMKLLHDFRHRGHALIEIAETPMSRLLDAARREHWIAAGDPPRPGHPPRHLLEHHDGFSTEPMEGARGGTGISPEEQWRRFEERYAEDAKEVVEWEARARQDFANRRDSAA